MESLGLTEEEVWPLQMAQKEKEAKVVQSPTNVYGNSELSITSNSEHTISRTLSDYSSTQTVYGVFWDLENCQIPKNQSPANVINVIRNKIAEIVGDGAR